MIDSQNDVKMSYESVHSAQKYLVSYCRRYIRTVSARDALELM